MQKNHDTLVYEFSWLTNLHFTVLWIINVKLCYFFCFLLFGIKCFWSTVIIYSIPFTQKCGIYSWPLIKTGVCFISYFQPCSYCLLNGCKFRLFPVSAHGFNISKALYIKKVKHQMLAIIIIICVMAAGTSREWPDFWEKAVDCPLNLGGWVSMVGVWPGGGLTVPSLCGCLCHGSLTTTLPHSGPSLTIYFLSFPGLSQSNSCFTAISLSLFMCCFANSPPFCFAPPPPSPTSPLLPSLLCLQ